MSSAPTTDKQPNRKVFAVIAVALIAIFTVGGLIVYNIWSGRQPESDNSQQDNSQKTQETSTEDPNSNLDTDPQNPDQPTPPTIDLPGDITR